MKLTEKQLINKPQMSRSIVREKSFEFNLMIIKLHKELLKQNEYEISKQLLRSATAIGANIEEALAGVSYKDYVAKMSVSLKETRESKCYLKLIADNEIINIDVEVETNLVDELIKMLTSIIKSSQIKAPIIKN